MRIRIDKFSKKADSKLLSIWWFAVLIAIGLGIVAGTLVFYSSKSDVRLAEAGILADRVLDCIVEQGSVSQEFLDLKFNVFETCGINKKRIESSGNYYLKISFARRGAGDLKEYPSYGNAAFEEDCKFGETMVKSEHYPICVEKSLIVSSGAGEGYIVNVKSGSNAGYRPEGNKDE